MVQKNVDTTNYMQYFKCFEVQMKDQDLHT